MKNISSGILICVVTKPKFCVLKNRKNKCLLFGIWTKMKEDNILLMAVSGDSLFHHYCFEL
jgi:hypothetical protein